MERPSNVTRVLIRCGDRHQAEAAYAHLQDVGIECDVVVTNAEAADIDADYRKAAAAAVDTLNAARVACIRWADTARLTGREDARATAETSARAAYDIIRDVTDRHTIR
jgi:hypothetical protein